MFRQLIFVFVFLSFFLLASEWEENSSQVLRDTLNRYHYVNQPIDDNYSKRVFNLFLNKIDPNKHFFTEKQIIDLQAYEYKIDNDIRNGSFNFFELCLNRLEKQIEVTYSIYNTVLYDPIDLNKKNYLETNFDKKKYTKNDTELMNLWKSSIQLKVAQNYINLYKEKYPSKNLLTIHQDLEIEARQKSKKNLNRLFKQIRQKSKKDYFIMYLDSIANAFGPHTSYLPPEEKEDFDINMSGQLEGIGAVLREEDGYIKVVKIIPGSASWRQGLLRAEDIILSVSQKNGDPVSIVETPVREAVKLIRGKKGTPVTLTVKKPDGLIRNISIVRDVVIIKSTYAKYGIFNVNKTKIGYINLPSFYRDFENSNNRNAAGDVKKALFSLQRTDGLVLDLRNNGGGSLKDAIDISGFFIPWGPIVQVSDSNRSKDIYRDLNTATYYSKPLIVLVNSFSASASEIVSAALQDYGRAIIIGDDHTFGKGTVQKVINFDHILLKKQDKPLGYVKITIQEYFRITGKSTQFHGVTPDIIFPSPLSYLDVGEKHLKYAFEGSLVTPSNYKPWKSPTNPQVIKNSLARIKNNPITKKIQQYNSFMNLQKENSYRLISIKDLWNSQQLVASSNKLIEDLDVKQQFLSYVPLNEFDNIEDKDKELEKLTKKYKGDYVLNESFLVIKDMISKKL